MSSRPPPRTRRNDADLRAASQLAVDAVSEVSRVVEAMHRTIGSGPALLGRPLSLPMRLITAPIYGGIRAATRAVGTRLDAAFAQLGPALGESVPGPEREAVVAVLNGVLGDYLEETHNPLAVEMALRREGRPLPLDRKGLRAAVPGAAGKLLVLVHGSSMNDLQWSRAGHDHGAMLERELGVTAIYLHYNSGLHVSTNGRRLAALLEELASAWPVPLEEVVLLGHSMGGLVARSACFYAEAAGHRWRSKLRSLVTLGTPHHGAPLEQGGSWLHLLLGISAYSSPLKRLARVRSAGVTDLRFGNVIDADWEGRDRFEVGLDRREPVPLPEGVACYAVAAVTGTRATARLAGDGLVPVASALGRHRQRARNLRFPKAHQGIVLSTDHLGLLNNADVAAMLRGWLDRGDA